MKNKPASKGTNQKPINDTKKTQKFETGHNQKPGAAKGPYKGSM